MEGHQVTKDMIAPCGLYCTECPNHTGKIADMARDLRKELRAVRYDKTAEFLSTISWFKDFENYQDAYKVLGAMVKLRCKKGCRDGGGNPGCKIRKCTEKKGLEGCWDCEEFKTCKKLEYLEPAHGTGHLKNLASIKRNGQEKFLKGKIYWYAK